MSDLAHTRIERVRPLRRSRAVAARGVRVLLRVCLVLLVLCVLLVAIVTASARIGLPFLSAYKPTLETRLSEYLQSPVTIDELDTRWEGTGPMLRARGVQLTDPLGRHARFDELLIDVDVPRSLLAASPVVDELTMVGADLELDFDSAGAVRIRGVGNAGAPKPGAAKKKGGFNALAWLLTASRVGLLDTRLVVNLPDEQTLTLTDVNVRAENQGDVHQVRMDVRLPGEIGDRFELGTDLVGDAESLADGRGNVYIKATHLKAAGIDQLATAYGYEFPFLDDLAARGTQAQIELWGEIGAGQLSRVTGRTAIAQVLDDERVADSLFGDLSWTRLGDGGWEFEASDVVLGRQGAESVFDEIRMGASDTASKKPEWVQLSTSETDLLPVVNTVVSLVPSAVPDNLADWVGSVSPSARIGQAELKFDVRNVIETLQLDATLNALNWQPLGRLPGVVASTLTIDLIDGAGTITLPEQSLIVRPGPAKAGERNADPLPLEKVQWNAELDLPGQSLVGSLSINSDSRAGENASVGLEHRLQFGGPDSARLSANAEFAGESVSSLKPWLTQNWMPSGARSWLDRALLSGRVVNGTVQAEGLMKHWPFSGDQGTFRTEFDVKDASLSYLSSWPIAEAVDARVVLDGRTLVANVKSGRVDNLPIERARANIDNLYNPQLELTMASATDLAGLVKFGTTGPLRDFLNPILGGAEVDGPARLEVAVSTPLRQTPAMLENPSAPWPVSVKGNVFLQDSLVNLAFVDLPLDNVRGPIGFTEDGISLKTVRATLLGANVRLNAASVGAGAERRTDLALRGVLPARALLERFDLPVAGFVSGSSAWRADVSIPHNARRRQRSGIALTLTSDLVGTEFAMAEPLGKGSVKARALRLSTRFRPENTESGARQMWRLRMGDEDSLHSDTRFTVTNGALEGLSANLGNVLSDDPVEPGIRVVGRAEVFALDAMVSDLATLIDAIAEGQDDPGSDPEPVLPVFVDVYANNLKAGRTRLGDMSLRATTDSGYLNLFINNQHLRGSLRYPREHWRKDIIARVRLDYADKSLVDALSGDGEASDPKPVRLDPRTLPPIDLQVGQFVWDRLTIKDLTARTEPDISGLRIRTFGFATRDTQLIGEGLWHLVDPQGVNASLTDEHTAQLHLTLQSSDLGTALSGLGFQGVMAQGEGTVTASLNWPDAFYAPGIKTVAARASLDIKRGRLLQFEPGAARLAGLFALQTLPRRLSFDFKDIVNEGLDFKTITGDIALESGIAEMRLVQLNGPVGVIDITGTSDLVAQQFDQTVTVLPRVSAALPIIGIISGGASAGIGALIAGGVLKAAGVDFDRLGLRQFSLTGSWNKPTITPL